MGTNVEFIEEAACINRNMPLYVIHLAEDTLKKQKKKLQNSTFGILGVTYKKDVLDLRRTPSKTVITELLKVSKKVVVFDPLTNETFNATKGNFEETIKNKDCIILLVDHSNFRENNIEKTINEFAPKCCIIDTKNFIEQKKLKKSIIYRCLGKPLQSV